MTNLPDFGEGVLTETVSQLLKFIRIVDKLAVGQV